MSRLLTLALALILPLAAARAGEAHAKALPEIALSDKSSLSVFLPQPAQKGMTAVIICPGGGYNQLSVEGGEGNDTARWFAARGMVGITLKYRLPAQPGNSHASPLEDAHAAITLVRKRAAEWGIDAQKVGFLGYSAGGHVASTAGTHFDAATRPDFLLLIYPVITMGEATHAWSRGQLLGANPDPELVKLYSNELQVSKDTPPTFLVHASDDKAVSPRNSIDFYLALQSAGVPAELHLYERGDHGMRGGSTWGIGADTPTVASTWPQRALEWMQQRGLAPARK